MICTIVAVQLRIQANNVFAGLGAIYSDGVSAIY